MDKLVDVLTANGGEMEFSAFILAARQAGARPENWHKAKRAGLLNARIEPAVVDADGNEITPSRHLISIGGQ